ncbi:MAG TPA: endoribonuclease MazF [Candidatus Binatia bacterium]|nr:endoribonuclease MazF [Candidatus Binatia bacterium]
MARRYVPNRGDAVWVSFDPRAGHEQVGRRPAVVLSPEAYNGKVGLAILCPITSQVKGYPFEVMIPPDYQVGGVVLADQAKSLDWRVRKAEFICALPKAVILEVLDKLGTLLSPKE